MEVAHLLSCCKSACAAEAETPSTSNRRYLLSAIPMGDDPYDFEIALPAAPTNAGRSTRNHHSSSDSDEDVSGSISNMSGISSDDGSELERDQERKQRTESNFKRVTNSAIEPKTGASSSALDRAKTFLSKYSSAKTSESNDSKVPASSYSRRISLDSDDDDEFSTESSFGGEKEDIGSKKSYSTITTNTRDSDLSQSSKQQIITAQAQDTAVLQSDAEDESQSSDHLSPSSVVATSLPVVAIQVDDRSSGESQAGDSIESFHSGESQVKMETPQLTHFQDQQGVSAGENDESFQSLSQEIETKQTSAFTSTRLQQSSAFESEVYDEDAFEEDSTAMTYVPAHNSSTVTAHPTVNTEKNFDYSMDFSDEENKDQVLLEVHTSELTIKDSVPEDKSPTTSSRGDSDEDNREQSDFLESDSFRKGENDDHQLGRGAAEPVLVASCVGELRTSADNKPPGVEQSKPLSDLLVEELRHEHWPAAHFSLNSSIHNTKDRLSSNAVISPARPQMLLRQNKQMGEETTEVKQQHVEIIRAYKLDEDARVEMKDASTQFTGNHAAIQTDLVPDGMNNLATTSASFRQENEIPPSEAKSCQIKQQLPPTPTSPPLGTSTYSFDMLKMPMATSTSLYKQQLLTLQEQILQKKRETERIVHDRMAFQYSSLRGTERFIADRRVQKMELWEALMRVDPTLDERKAREAARLAQAATT